MNKTIFTLILSFISFVCLANCISGDCDNGEGVYRFKNGNVYKGAFKNGKPHGLGTLKTPKGLCKAHWIDGRREGKAVWKFKNKSKLYCNYHNNKKHGKAKLVNEDHKPAMLYLWEHGKLAKKKKITNTERELTDQGEKIPTKPAHDTSKQSEEKVEVAEIPVSAETSTTAIATLSPGDMISFYDKYKYNTGDGSFFGNLMGSYFTANYSITFYGVVEQKLGDRYKIVITDAKINDPKWASVNYFNYKSYAINDMNSKIGNTVFKTVDEVEVVK